MPAMSNCQNMSQFGFNQSHHWGYGTSSGYSSWPGSLSGCTAASVTASGFNSSTLGASGFAATVPDINGHQTNQDGVFATTVALPDASTTSTGLELEQQLMSSSTHLHNGHNIIGDASTIVPKYAAAGSECLSGGTRSLSDSSNGESPIGNDDLYGGPNGHTMTAATAAAAATTTSSFHHHHMHHHSAGNSYHNSHYPMLPASLFYSQLYHSGSNASRHQMLDETEEQRCSNVATTQRVTNDNVAVWRPY